MIGASRQPILIIGCREYKPTSTAQKLLRRNSLIIQSSSFWKWTQTSVRSATWKDGVFSSLSCYDIQRKNRRIRLLRIEYMELNYTDLLKNYNNMIKYALQNSTAFSMIFHAKKPYAQSPPIYQEGEVKIAKSLERCIEKQIIGIRKWPGNGSRSNDRVCNIYRSCSHAQKILLTDNLFDAVNTSLPEDLCFYRKDTAWFVTISHEALAFMYFETQTDIDYLQKNSIHYRYPGNNTTYLHPKV